MLNTSSVRGTMRNNQPITANQKTFSSNIKLISVTDLHGNITECNEHFVQVSGFSREELIGQPHNLVRHPDMPELAFRTMWTCLLYTSPSPRDRQKSRMPSSA